MTVSQLKSIAQNKMMFTGHNAQKPKKELPPEVESLHQAACDAGEYYYRDPKTGFHVWTSLYHSKRGHCCQSGCRHCPFGFEG